MSNEKPVRRRQVIYMADNEWSSQERGGIMERIATEALKGPDAPDCVEVVEHAGWWLVYGLIGGVVKIVATANDQAHNTPEINTFWHEYNRGKETYMDNIRRPKKEEKVAA